MNYPPGTLQYLKAIGAFKPVRWCSRCGTMVSRWHEHHTKQSGRRAALPAAQDWPKEEVSPGVWVDVDPESIAKAAKGGE